MHTSEEKKNLRDRKWIGSYAKPWGLDTIFVEFGWWHLYLKLFGSPCAFFVIALRLMNGFQWDLKELVNIDKV